jgi:hypothetical protein
LLVAGVPPDLIRGILLGSQAAGARSQRQARELTALGALRGILTGLWLIGVNRDKRKPESFDTAFNDLDRWDGWLLAIDSYA